MATQVKMPQMGESVVEGTVSQWLVAEGAEVERDAPLLLVTTDKVDTEIPAPIAGRITKIHVAEGQTVAAGTLLAEMVAKDEDPSGPVPQAPGGASPDGGASEGLAKSHLNGLRPAPEMGPDRQAGFLSPVVAAMAAEHGIDLAAVRGTGLGGRVTKRDLVAYLAGRSVAQAASDASKEYQPGVMAVRAAEPQSPEQPEARPMTAVRRSIASHMLLSQRSSAQVTTVFEADMTRVANLRERLRPEFEQQGVKLTFTPFFAQAIIAGLRTVPEANSTLEENTLLVHRAVHLGVAVAVPGGLLVPVIRHADGMDLLGLARQVQDLAERARQRRLLPAEVTGGTFTLTNHGTSGSLLATPIINQPQAGILGVGRIQKRPVVISRGHAVLPDAEDYLSIRPMVYLSFTFDHRILDGADADAFLATVKQHLEGGVG